MINFTHTPPTFTPVYTDGLFFTVSADTNHFKFRYVYDLYVNGTLAFEGKATPNPFDLGVIDLSRILKTYTENNPISSWNKVPIYTHQTFPFSIPYKDEVIYYDLYVGYEYADSEISQVTGFTGSMSGTSDIIGPPSETVGTYKTFLSTMGVNGRANQQDFNISPFVLSGTPVGSQPTTSGLFLTNSPRIRNIQPTEYYTLAFTNYYLDGSTLSEPYYVQYKFYDDEGVLLTTINVDNITTNGGGPRTNCNNVYQELIYVNPTATTVDYNTVYVGAGPVNLYPIFPNNTAQYTVQLFGKFTGTTSPINPTPTPTPTPSPTPTISCTGECGNYIIQNNNLQTLSVEFLDCETGTIRRRTIGASSAIQVDCLCPDTVTSAGNFTLIANGACPNTQPCANCYSVTLYNNNDLSCKLTYFNCTTQAWTTYTLPAKTAVTFPCACPAITRCKGVTLYQGSACTPGTSPTPTPSVTPTFTPSPTPTCAYKAWSVLAGKGACDTGTCSITGPFFATIYTNCSVSDIYAAGAYNVYTNSSLTTPFTDYWTDATDIFVVSGGSVVVQCTIGGGC